MKKVPNEFSDTQKIKTLLVVNEVIDTMHELIEKTVCKWRTLNTARTVRRLSIAHTNEMK